MLLNHNEKILGANVIRANVILIEHVSQMQQSSTFFCNTEVCLYRVAEKRYAGHLFLSLFILLTF
jgi:hypothetical protein